MKQISIVKEITIMLQYEKEPQEIKIINFEYAG